MLHIYRGYVLRNVYLSPTPVHCNSANKVCAEPSQRSGSGRFHTRFVFFLTEINQKREGSMCRSYSSNIVQVLQKKKKS